MFVSEHSRIGFLDVARGIGIVCVLLGHNLWSQSRASAIIFSFHVVLYLHGRFRQVSWDKLLKVSVGNREIPGKRGLESV